MLLTGRASMDLIPGYVSVSNSAQISVGGVSPTMSVR
ncbi:MAG: hypothetical protein MAG471_00344 [Acidimicrobiaceae bacterium]|nr:hypothetical protein [Acidimicrobiaceae bacterium]